MAEEKKFSFMFSHEIGDGASGPARSYWDILYRGRPLGGMIPLHPRCEGSPDPELTMGSIIRMLEDAFEAGRRDKAEEIRGVLGLGRF